LVVLIPWLGVLIYLIANHQGMAERRYREAAESREAWARSHGVASFKDAMAIGLVAVSKMPLVDGAQ